MNNLEEALNKLESGIKLMFEGSLLQFLPDTDITNQMSDYMVEIIKKNTDEKGILANVFIIQVNPEIAEAINASPEIESQLTDSLIDAISTANLNFDKTLEIKIVANYELKPDEINIVAANDIEEVQQTVGVEVTSNVFGESVPDNAFLIINGTKFYPLTRTVINIGRRKDNHLVINDERVSRLHAQIRLINGNFVIFDLDSVGGTMVNNLNIHKAVLHPGDVISLAGVPLVFGQESSIPDETQDLTE